MLNMPFQTHLKPLLTVSLLLVSGSAGAQTTPAAPTSAPAPTAPAKPSSPTSAATSRAASATAITVSKAIKGQLINCPTKLKVSKQAVCLYVKAAAAGLRLPIKDSLGGLPVGDWKTVGTASSLLVRETPTGNLGAFVLLSPLSAAETLVVVDGVTAAAPTAVKIAPPTGVVKGQPYLLDKDLAGVVNVVNLGGGKYRMNAAGQTAITVTTGSKTAQRPGGNVDLPLAPVTDGKNLIFPVAGLRALGCTVTDAGTGVTIACGSDSVGVKPIVF